jgi:hypothetical protein
VQNNYAVIVADDMNYLFEAAGTLINNPKTIPSLTQDHLLSSFIQPQIGTITSLLQQQQQSYAGDKAATIAMILSTVASLSKGFNKVDMTPTLNSLFMQALEVAILSLQSLPAELEVRSKSIMLIHRTILLLEDDVIGHVPSILFPMVSACKKEDLTEVVQLMNQLMIKFQGKVSAGIDAVVPTFLRRYGELVPQSDEGSSAQVEIERVAVTKLYMLFLQHIASNNCANVLISASNIGEFSNVLNMMLSGVAMDDLSVKKSNLQFFTNLCKSCCCDSDASLHAMYWDFTMQKTLVGTMQMLMDVKFNLKDAQGSRVTGEASSLLFVALQRKPANFQEFLAALGGYCSSSGRGAASCAVLQQMVECADEAKMKKLLQQFLLAWRS